MSARERGQRRLVMRHAADLGRRLRVHALTHVARFERLGAWGWCLIIKPILNISRPDHDRRRPAVRTEFPRPDVTRLRQVKQPPAVLTLDQRRWLALKPKEILL